MKRYYAGAIIATNPRTGDTTAIAVVVLADNERHANEMAFAISLERLPRSHGWIKHAGETLLVPDLPHQEA